MNYLSVENLTKSVADKMLFKDLTFGINKGEKVALIAKNGAGKSSLLRLLVGKDTPDSGNISFRGEIQYGYLEQAPEFDPGLTVSQAVFVSDNPILKAIAAYEQAMLFPDRLDLMESSLAKMDELNAWEYEVKVKQILSKLHIDKLEETVGNLSGGQQKRIALAQILIANPDFIILDEPTNHLDLDIIEWMEEYLAKENKTILMVTHDRYFLECVCNHILELEDETLYKYEGNYSQYLEAKEERQSQYQTELGKARNLMKKELEWVRRQPKARGTKAKYRMDAFDDIKQKAKGKNVDKNLDMDLSASRLGKKILEIDGLTKHWGDYTVLDDFSYIFKKNEKIGIVGKNGVGKTTFLNLLTGKEAADNGEVVHGQTLKVGYYTQKGIDIEDGKKVIEVIKDIAEFIPQGNGSQISASQMLEKFLFTPEMQWNYVSKLSGGERKRLYMLTILMSNPNFLILDEPTNDLDIVTLNVLEDYLAAFQGCVLIVSHDRYFMDKIVDHLFVFEGDGLIKDFSGTYTEYHDFQKDLEREQRENKNNKKPAPVKEVKVEVAQPEVAKRKLSYKEKLEFQEIEKKMPELEDRKSKLEKELSAVTEAFELQKLSEQFQLISEEIDELELRWLELSEGV